MPFQIRPMNIGAILRGTGTTKVPMQIAVVTNAIVVVLNSVLIFGRFGFPALAQGPAVSTIIGQAIGDNCRKVSVERSFPSKHGI